MSLDEFDSGTRKLIEDLLSKPQSFARDEILHRARRLKYHDFKSDDPTPEQTLYRHMLNAGYKDLALSVTEGKYDQDREESRKWAEGTEEGRQLMEMAKDPTVRKALDGLMVAAVALKPAVAAAVKKDLARHPDVEPTKEKPS